MQFYLSYPQCFLNLLCYMNYAFSFIVLLWPVYLSVINAIYYRDFWYSFNNAVLCVFLYSALLWFVCINSYFLVMQRVSACLHGVPFVRFVGLIFYYILFQLFRASLHVRNSLKIHWNQPFISLSLWWQE